MALLADSHLALLRFDCLVKAAFAQHVCTNLSDYIYKLVPLDNIASDAGCEFALCPDRRDQASDEHRAPEHDEEGCCAGECVTRTRHR